ncbi:MAG: prepilin peptidase [Lachnospiraceae bacterium]|nr:prepilin peptidase [Lachnospiraceae bacterium]
MDIRTDKVRNGWVAVIFLLSVVLRFREKGFVGLGIGFTHMLLAFLVLLPIFAFRALGAADIKILLSLSVLFPIQDMLILFLISLVIGAVIGIVRYHLISNFGRIAARSKFHYIHFTIPIFISVVLYEYGGLHELLSGNL